jgi:hypothetical protein
MFRGVGYISGKSKSAPSLNLDFLLGGLDSRITFTRASNAWYFDSAGNLVQASTNEPRFDYDPATLQARGLLIEGGRTNGIRNPRLEGAVAGNPGTVPTHMATGATGGISGEVFGVGSENGIPYVDFRFTGTVASLGVWALSTEQVSAIAATSGQVWAGSFYWRVVSGSGPTVWQINWQEYDSGGTALADVNVAVAAPTTAALRTQRVVDTRTLAGGTTAFVRNRVRIAFPAGTYDFTLRIGAPQLELGSFPTSPIFPAVGSPAASTRAADNVSVATLTPWFNPNEGTILVEYQRPFVGFNQFEVNFSDGTYGEFIGLYTSATNQIAEIRQGAASQAGLVLEAGAGVNDRLNKKILAYQVNNFAASLNGAAPIVDTSGSVPIGLTTMRIGTFQGGSQFCSGWISRIAYYPTRLSNTTLQGLTS